MVRAHFFLAAFMVSFFLWPRPMRAGETAALIDPEGVPTEQALEALLAPGEFPGRRFEYTSEGEEALFSLDSSLSASEPFAAIHPERLVWPRIADLELKNHRSGPAAHPGLGPGG